MADAEDKLDMHPEVMDLLNTIEIKEEIAFMSVDAMNYWLNLFLPRPREEKVQIAVDIMHLVERFRKLNLKLFREAIVQLTVLVTIILASPNEAKVLAKKAGLSTEATNKVIGKEAMDYQARLNEKKAAGPGGVLGLLNQQPKDNVDDKE